MLSSGSRGAVVRRTTPILVIAMLTTAAPEINCREPANPRDPGQYGRTFRPGGTGEQNTEAGARAGVGRGADGGARPGGVMLAERGAGVSRGYVPLFPVPAESIMLKILSLKVAVLCQKIMM